MLRLHMEFLLIGKPFIPLYRIVYETRNSRPLQKPQARPFLAATELAVALKNMARWVSKLYPLNHAHAILISAKANLRGSLQMLLGITN